MSTPPRRDRTPSEALIAGPNEVERLHFEGIRSLMMGRTALEAPLVNVPGKMIHGSYAMAHVLPTVARAIEARVPAEELGRRLKQTSVQMSVGLGGLLFTYVLGRIQRNLDAGWPKGRVDDDEDAAFLYSWWARAMSQYRNDDVILPTPARPGWPILTAETVTGLAAQAMERGPVTDIEGGRRAIASFEAFIFMLHADARDGINHHGPYELGDGRILLVKEHTDIQNIYLPWGPDHRADVSRVVVVLVLQGVDCHVDLVGGLAVDPQNYLERCVGFDVLVADDLRSASEAEWHEIAERLRPINRSLFKLFMSWNDHQKLDHGAVQYGNVLRGWMETAGFSEAETWSIVIEPFVAAGDEYTDRLVRGDHPAIWDFVLGDDPQLIPIQEVSG